MKSEMKITLHLSKLQADSLQLIARESSEKAGTTITPDTVATVLFNQALEQSAALWAKGSLAPGAEVR
jgi:hypothetical protein